MPDSLLTTKLYAPPPRPRSVARRRLLDRLEAGLRQGRRLTLVSAPAGYGKTTLVSAWLHQVNRPFSWLSLDEGDNDLARFLAHLVAALQTIPGLATRSPVPPFPSTSPVQLLTPLVNDIAAVTDPFVLVLDEYETLTEFAVHEVVGFLLAHQPAPLHLAIVTRQDPPLPLARLRARGQITEVRMRDLRFTEEEAGSFLHDTMGLDLAPEDIALLESHTEGWVAGLQLAALSLQEEQDPGHFIRAFAGDDRHVQEYLLEEVLARQPAAVQTFLLKTAVLKRFNASLCDALVYDEAAPGDSRPMLERLEEANLFLTPLDNRRSWYRYHPLFAELLEYWLHREHPDWVPALHRRAALWHDSQGLALESVRHALSAQDFELAADLMEKTLRKTSAWSGSDPTTLLRWLRTLPDTILRAYPWLWLLSIRARSVQEGLEDVDQELQELETVLAERSSGGLDTASMRVAIQLDRANYAVMCGRLQQAMALARAILPQLSQDDRMSRFRMLSLYALAHYRAGDLIEAGRLFPQAIELVVDAGMPFAAVALISNMAEMYIMQGHLDDALQLCQQALALGTVEGHPISMTGMISLPQSRVAYERNDLLAAERLLTEGLERLRQGGITDSFGVGHALLALVRQARGDAVGARESMDQSRQIAGQVKVARVAGVVAAYQARIQLAQGQLDAAMQWAQDYRQAGPAEYLREFEDLTLARVLLAMEETSAALALLERLSTATEESGRMGTVLEATAWRALALQATGDESGALQTLGRALALAEPEGWVRVFVDGGAAMAHLLARALEQGIAPSYTFRLLAILAEEQERTASPESVRAARRSSAPPLVEPPSDRELEVLELVAAGFSNRAIADRLCLSVHTVKSHTCNVYGKLGVHSRVQAVKRAHALGLLDR